MPPLLPKDTQGLQRAGRGGGAGAGRAARGPGPAAGDRGRGTLDVAAAAAGRAGSWELGVERGAATS
jgi:hypothetical protein